MKTITPKQLRQDVEDVLSVLDYDFDQAGRHEETLPAYNRVRELMAASPQMLQALKEAKELVALADKYFPKSIRNSDKFKLLLTDAAINKAIPYTANL